MKNSEKTLDMIVNLCKNRGFVYAGSEIYGGLANAWDYGPLAIKSCHTATADLNGNVKSIISTK